MQMDPDITKVNGSCWHKKVESAHLLLREEEQISQSVAQLLRQIHCSFTCTLSISLAISSSANKRCGEKQ